MTTPRKCIQTVNVWGHNPDGPTNEDCGSSGSMKRSCAHHVYLPEPEAEPVLAYVG